MCRAYEATQKQASEMASGMATASSSEGKYESLDKVYRSVKGQSGRTRVPISDCQYCGREHDKGNVLPMVRNATNVGSTITSVQNAPEIVRQNKSLYTKLHKLIQIATVTIVIT